MTRIVLNDPEVALLLALEVMHRTPPVLLITFRPEVKAPAAPAAFQSQTLKDLKLAIMSIDKQALPATLTAAELARFGCTVVVFPDKALPDKMRDHVACLSLHRGGVSTPALVSRLDEWLTTFMAESFAYFFVQLTPSGEGGT